MRYTVKPFSPSLVGIWDKQAGEMVKNPASGRRRLFYRRANAEKLAKKLNEEAPETPASPAPEAKRYYRLDPMEMQGLLQPAPVSLAPIDLRQRQELKDARASMADLAARQPEILDPRQSDRYITRIVGVCRYCGDEMVVEIEEDADIYAVLDAIKDASGECTCYAERRAAQAFKEIEEGLDPIGEGE